MSEGKKPTIRKLKKEDYDKGNLKRNISNPDYQQLLKCISDEDSKLLAEQPDSFPYLYPNKDDENFNIKIAKKKEFFDTRYEPHTKEEYEDIDAYTQTLCDEKEFELDPHQMFVRNFMSFQTPYNGLTNGYYKTHNNSGIASCSRKFQATVI